MSQWNFQKMVCADPAEACRSCLQKIYSPMNTLERFSDRIKRREAQADNKEKEAKVSKNISGKPGKKEKPYETGEKRRTIKLMKKRGRMWGSIAFFLAAVLLAGCGQREQKSVIRAKGRDNSGDIGGDGGGSRDKWAGKWDEGGLSVCD